MNEDMSDAWVCIDCGMFLENNELPHENPHNWSPDNIDDSVTWLSGDSDKDEEFSTQDCDCCGMSLGGYRYHMVMWFNKEG